MSRCASRTAATIAALALAVLFMGALPARAEPDLVARINSERSARGLSTVRVASDLASVAAEHTRQMVDDGAIYHVPDLERRAPGWAVLGDNVGAGAGIDSIFEGFMDSASHRENLLRESFTHLGVGVVETEDFVYATVILGARSVPVRATRAETSLRPRRAPSVLRGAARPPRPSHIERPRRQPAKAPAAPSLGPGAAVRALVALTHMDAEGSLARHGVRPVTAGLAQPAARGWICAPPPRGCHTPLLPWPEWRERSSTS